MNREVSVHKLLLIPIVVCLLLIGIGTVPLLPTVPTKDYDPNLAIGMKATETYEDHFCMIWNVTNCDYDRAMVVVNTSDTATMCTAGPFRFKRNVCHTGNCPGPTSWAPRNNPAPGTYGCVKAGCRIWGVMRWTTPHATVVLASDDWQDFQVYSRMEIAGIGMSNGGTYVNPQSIEMPAEATWMQAQVAGIGTEPTGVSFDTAIQSNVPGVLVYDGSSLWVHEAGLLPSSVITATVEEVDGHPRALVIYAKYETANPWTSTGATLDGSVHHSTITQTLTIPDLAALETTIYVTVVVIDNNDDDRPICVRAGAGDVSIECCENGPTHGDGLNIYTLTLQEVPQGTSEISVTVKSPVINGDSARWIGVNVTYEHLEE